MNSKFDTWYTDYIDDENKSVREAAKAAWEFMQSRLESMEKDVVSLEVLLHWSALAAEGKSLAVQLDIDQLILSRVLST